MIEQESAFGDGLHDPGGDRYVEVLYARSHDEAVQRCKLLHEQTIPANIENRLDRPPQCGVAVLVPSDRLIDATVVLAVMSQDLDEDEIDQYDVEEPDEGDVLAEEVEEEEDLDPDFDHEQEECVLKDCNPVIDSPEDDLYEDGVEN